MSTNVLELLIRAVERIGALALVAYILILWMPDQTRRIDQIATTQAQQAVALERVVHVLDRIDRDIRRP